MCLFYDEIAGVLFIPLRNQLWAGLANMFAIDNGASEDARNIGPIAESGVGAILDVERTIERDGGCPGTQPFYLNRTPGAHKFDAEIAQLLYSLICRAFHQTRGA